jgi:hypothetical protein
VDRDAEDCHYRVMGNDPNRFKRTLEALERAAHVPTDAQVEEQPDTETNPSAWAWDEERRQARLAGGA